MKYFPLENIPILSSTSLLQRDIDSRCVGQSAKYVTLFNVIYSITLSAFRNVNVTVSIPVETATPPTPFTPMFAILMISPMNRLQSLYT